MSLRLANLLLLHPASSLTLLWVPRASIRRLKTGRGPRRLSIRRMIRVVAFGQGSLTDRIGAHGEGDHLIDGHEFRLRKPLHGKQILRRLGNHALVYTLERDRLSHRLGGGVRLQRDVSPGGVVERLELFQDMSGAYAQLILASFHRVHQRVQEAKVSRVQRPYGVAEDDEERYTGRRQKYPIK